MRLLLFIAIAVLPFLTFGQVPFSLQDRAFLASTSPLRNGLVGYWRLEESSGTRFDCSKNGNHLTSNNSVGQAAGVSGYTGSAASFVSASSQYLDRASNTSLQVGDIDFTIAAWVKLNATTTFQTIASKYQTTGDQREYQLMFDNAVFATKRFVFLISSDGTVSGTNTVIASNFGEPAALAWYHVVASHDSVNNKITISVNNGTANETSVTGGIFAGSSAFWIGGRNGAAQYMNGSIDEIGIWKRVLTAAERTQLYNAGLGTHFPWAHP